MQFTCHVDPDCELAEKCLVPGSAEYGAAGCHRWCPLPHYAVVSCLIGFMTVAIFLRLPIMVKGLLLAAMAVVHVLMVELSHKRVFECFDARAAASGMPPDAGEDEEPPSGVPLDVTSVIVVAVFAFAVGLHGRQVEWMARLDFLWQLQAREEKVDMENLQSSNKRILFNLLPAHVATHFLDNQFRSNMVIITN